MHPDTWSKPLPPSPPVGYRYDDPPSSPLQELPGTTTYDFALALEGVSEMPADQPRTRGSDTQASKADKPLPPLPSDVGFSPLQEYKFPHSEALSDALAAADGFQTRFRRILTWTNVCITLLLSILLAGIYGNQLFKVQQSLAPSQPTSPSSSPPPSSTPRGAWPGTSLTSAFNTTSSQGYLFFQTSTGELIHMTYTYSPSTHRLSHDSTATFTNLHQSNRTSLSAQIWPFAAPSNPSLPYAGQILHLVYVAENGTLADVVRPSDSSPTQYTWVHGALWKQGIKTALVVNNTSDVNVNANANVNVSSRRAALEFIVDPIFGRTSPGGARLWHADPSGSLSCVAYDAATAAWSASAESYPYISGLDGVGVAIIGDGQPWYETILFARDAAPSSEVNGSETAAGNAEKEKEKEVVVVGEMDYWTQVFNNSHARDWPFGAGWLGGHGNASVPVAAGGGWTVSWPWMYLDSGGKGLGIQGVEIDEEDGFEGLWKKGYDGKLEDSVGIASGTDFASVKVDGGIYTILLYQDDPSSIAWIVLANGTNPVSNARGHFVYDSASKAWKDGP